MIETLRGRETAKAMISAMSSAVIEVATQAGVEKVRPLAEHGVPTIHLSIGIEPLGVECDRIHVITDPADALDRIATDTVSALRASTQRRPAPRPT